MGALHEAINGWEDDQITWLLEHNADVNEPDENGNTPLMLAAVKGIYAWHIQALLERGADIHARDRAGRTPLMLALDNRSFEGVGEIMKQYLLLGETPEVDASFEQGRIALLFAIYKNDVDAISTLIEAGVDPNALNMSGLPDYKVGRTPLMAASELGRAEAVECLLIQGANVHTRETNGNGWTALHIAAYDAHSECVRLLLKYGAEVDARDSTGSTPLIDAAFASDGESVRLLLEYGAHVHAEDNEGTSALMQAGWLGDEETIRTLLECGAASNYDHLRLAFRGAFVDNNHDKAPIFIEAGLKIGLTEAVLLNDIPQIKRLLENVVAPDEINRALITAASHATPAIVRLLLKHGADPNAFTNTQTALMQAYWNFVHSSELINILLEAGADVNARDEEGRTPFSMLISSNMSDISLMQKMLERGADVNAQPASGMTVIMEAARRGEISVVRFLLQHGANTDLQDREGYTALMYAASGGHTEIVQLLLEHGAATDACATNGNTPLSLAKRWGGKDIARILQEAGAME